MIHGRPSGSAHLVFEESDDELGVEDADVDDIKVVVVVKEGAGPYGEGNLGGGHANVSEEEALPVRVSVNDHGGGVEHVRRESLCESVHVGV